MSNKLYSGIDVANDTFAAAVWESTAQTARLLGCWANTATGITAFTTGLQHLQPQPPPRNCI